MSSEKFPGFIDTTYRKSRSWVPKQAAAPTGAPHVVFVVLDDVGFGQLGCYGSEIETPRMDALAAGGRRYSNFHTASMCSPTRAALLTGRNHHAVGMGTISDWCTGYPGYQGQVSNRAATLAEILRPHGYNTFATGKWHLARGRDSSAAGPFDQWPLGRGFERYYGFLCALMDHWNPELYCDNHAIPKPDRPDYHLTEDLIDQTIGFIRDQQNAAPDKPFFAYVALGACHSPHHAPKEFIEKYKGRFDHGWDEARRRCFERQLALGIVPSGTQLAPLHSEVTPWAQLSPDQQRLCARMQEVFAGFLDHTDQQIGRLIDYLESRQLMDNTLFVLLSDNGASDEGTQFGDINVRRHYVFLDEPFEEKLASIDQLGGEQYYNHYPAGWAHVGNTPLKRFKKNTHGGGIRDPLIIHWPARITEGGQVSGQFHHCADLVPTVLELLKIDAPVVHQGVEQIPIQGTSMAYTFDQPVAPTRKRVQYFEMLGDRGIWADGWKAVSHHVQGSDFEQDRWELYHLDSDFSECHDLAADHPEKLDALIAPWWREAQSHQVLPLDDRDRVRSYRSFKNEPRTRFRYEPFSSRIGHVVTPPVGNRSYRIAADVEICMEDEGVLFAAGGRFGGYVLFVQNGRLVHEYAGPDRHWMLESTRLLTPGRHALGVSFRKTGSCAGTLSLLCDDTIVASQEMGRMWPFTPNVTGAFCGRDESGTLSSRYTAPFAFSGVLYEVVVEVDSDYVADSQLEYLLALSED